MESESHELPSVKIFCIYHEKMNYKTLDHRGESEGVFAAVGQDSTTRL